MKREGSILVVPWADKSEWRAVRSKITSEKVEDVIEAYQIISVWKLRCNSLPAYIDCTAGILQVMVQEQLSKTSPAFNDYDLRLSYSTAIIRFVNHVHDVSESRYNTLYSSAKIQNIPDWIVTMRHDAAHGQDLPALETFHLAAKVSIEWLLENYWFHEELYLSNLNQTITSFGDDVLTNDVNLKLYPIYKKAVQIWKACGESIKNSRTFVSHLSPDNLSCILSLVELCKSNESIQGNGINYRAIIKKLYLFYKSTGKCKLKDLKMNITELIKCITCDSAAKYTFVQSIVQSDFMLDFMQTEWKELIYFIQTLKCFPIFLKSLFQLAADNHDVALDLLNSLASSIKILKNQWPKYKKIFKINVSDKKSKKKAKKKYSRCYKSVRFPLKLRKPPKINLEMIEDLLNDPREQSKKVICAYLELLDPPLPRPLLNEANSLINIYCGPETQIEHSFDETEKIYTLEDIKLQLQKPKESDTRTTPVQSSNGINSWNRSNINAETWSCCPLGLLPHQKTINLTIPKELKWRPESTHPGKRPAPPLTIQSSEMKKLRIFETNVKDY